MNRPNLLALSLFFAILLAFYMSSPMPSSPDPTPAMTAIVVGSGLAGLSAASTLLYHNVNVRLLERASKPGGNSIKASSGINGSPTPQQPLQEPPNAFYEDTIRSAGPRMATLATERKRLTTALTNDSASAIAWLQGKGIDLSRVARLGGHSYARTHRGAGPLPPGYAIVSTLLKEVSANPLFTLQTGSDVTRLLAEGGRVTGVEYTHDGQTKTLRGPVVMAAGGFGGDAVGLLAKYRPGLTGMPSTNEPGPGPLPLLTAVGAELVDMEDVQIHPTGFVDPSDSTAQLKFLAAELLRGEGGILLRNGARFVNELDTRERVASVIMSSEPSSASEPPRQWPVAILLDESTFAATGTHGSFYASKSLLRKTTFASLSPIAQHAVQTYSAAIASGSQDPFNRPTHAHWSLTTPTADSVLYIGTVTPVIHFTMGGARTDEHGAVLGTGGKAIEGLWAAGEVVGGVHGANRLGGSSLLECVVFGRRVGDGVAGFLKGV